ncbi:proteasome subunit beta [Ruegeria phage RpAliso]|nr:proteasome subunit beta [Ruegeria phage RpAliso]
MTTIAYDGNVLAADTMLSRGSETDIGLQKIFMTRRFLLGVSGDAADIIPMLHFVSEVECLMMVSETVMDFYRYWARLPHILEDHCAILVDHHGDCYSLIDGPPVRVPRGMDAIGSGAKYALGAMAYSASAKKAVEIASSYDAYTGGPIETLSVSSLRTQMAGDSLFKELIA